MPNGPKPRRQPADTVRLKRDIAKADSTVRGLSRAMATSGLAESHPAMQNMRADASRTLKRANAQADSLNDYRKGAPTGTHKSFAQNTDAFDGAALTTEGSPKPPHVSIPRGQPTPDALPSATGTPALAQRAPGTDNLRADYKCFEAGDARSTSGGKSRKPAGVQSFDDSAV